MTGSTTSNTLSIYNAEIAPHAEALRVVFSNSADWQLDVEDDQAIMAITFLDSAEKRSQFIQGVLFPDEDAEDHEDIPWFSEWMDTVCDIADGVIVV